MILRANVVAQRGIGQFRNAHAEQLGHATVGLLYNSLGRCHQIAIGGQLEQLPIASALGLYNLARSHQFDILLAQLFAGSLELAQHLDQFLQNLRQAVGQPVPHQ